MYTGTVSHQTVSNVDRNLMYLVGAKPAITGRGAAHNPRRYIGDNVLITTVRLSRNGREGAQCRTSRAWLPLRVNVGRNAGMQDGLVHGYATRQPNN